MARWRHADDVALVSDVDRDDEAVASSVADLYGVPSTRSGTRS
jgi:hypothetical protein